MPKTYTAVTVANATAGNAILASDHSTNFQNVNNLIVPPVCQVVRTTNLTSYTSNADISWATTAAIDTDGMFAAGSPTRITIQTSGLYLVTLLLSFTCTATATLFAGKIVVDGTEAAISYHAVTGGTASYSSTTAILSLTASSYLTARGAIVGGSAYIINGAATATNDQSRLTAQWIGRTS